MLVMPFSATAEPKASELSSIFQPVISTALDPLFVTSNQSAATGLLPLDHGATSEMERAGRAGVSFTTLVMARVKGVLASGLAPRVGSSTLTVTE
jgi:hypothetical protein